MLALTAASFAQISVVVSFGPPPLPIYEQPLCPGEGYIWTPGFWAWDNDFDDYYWVPGTWVLAPQIGFLWTPGWWGWGGEGFIFHEGYWGPVVGFYGGINYGFGYFGHGYEGGRWENDHFYYNRAVNNVNVTNIHNVYNTTVINNTTVNRVSYNGGNGGIDGAADTAGTGCRTREPHSAGSGPNAARPDCPRESAVACFREPGQAAYCGNSEARGVSRQWRSTRQTGWRAIHSSSESCLKSAQGQYSNASRPASEQCPTAA